MCIEMWFPARCNLIKAQQCVTVTWESPEPKMRLGSGAGAPKHSVFPWVAGSSRTRIVLENKVAWLGGFGSGGFGLGFR